VEKEKKVTAAVAALGIRWPVEVDNCVPAKICRINDVNKKFRSESVVIEVSQSVGLVAEENSGVSTLFQVNLTIL